VPRKFDLEMTRNTSISWHNQIGQAKTRKATHSLAFQFYYLSFPIYVLLDLDMFSASIEITYSVQVVLRFLLADKRNLPFSISTADPHQKKKRIVNNCIPKRRNVGEK